MKLLISLWEHQQRMLDSINAHPQLLLVAGCGVGKTLAALASIQPEHKRVLIVTVKAALRSVWERDFQRFIDNDLGYHFEVLDKGTIADRNYHVRTNVLSHERFILVCNYESAYKLNFEKWGIDYIIFDECHKLKNPTGVIAKNITLKSLNILKKLAMSGTVWDKRYEDVYGQVRALDGVKVPYGVISERFGSYKKFFDTYVIYYQHGYIKIPTGYKNTEQLKQTVADISLVVKSEDVLDLPPDFEIYRPYQLSSKAQKQYEALYNDLILKVGDGVVTVNNVLTEMLRLRQMLNGTITDDEGKVHIVSYDKCDALMGLIEEIDEDEPIVIFTQFKTDIQIIGEALSKAGITYAQLTGDLNQYPLWRDDKSIRVLLAQIRAGSVGLDFTKARYAVYYTIPDSNNDLIQSKARIRRPNARLDVPVFYYFLLAEGTVESHLLSLLKTSERYSQAMYEFLQNQQKGVDKKQNLVVY